MFARTPIVVALIGAAAIAAQAQRGRLDVQDVGLPALNVGLVMDTSRAPDSPVSRATSRRAGGDSRRRASRCRADGRAGPRHRSLPRRRTAGRRARPRSARSRRGGTIATRPSYADFDLVRIDAADDPEAVAAALEGAACRRRRERPGCVSLADDAEAERPAVRHEAVEPPVREHRAGMGHSTVRGLRHHRRGASTAASRIGAPRITANIPAFSVGILDLPRAEQRARFPSRRADQLVNASTREPDRRAVRLHLGRRHAARLRGPRHARRRHHRPAHERQHRARRGRVQRQADAGQGDRRRVGLPAGLAELRHRRSRRARNPLRGGSRREGSQHEHRADRVRRRSSSRTPSAMPSAAAPSWWSPPGTSTWTAIRCRFSRKSARASTAPCRSRPSIATRQHASYSTSGPYVETRRAGRRRQHARILRHRQFHRAADLRLPLHRHLSAAARRSTGRRGSTCSATSAMPGRRWRRRTSPAPRRS